MTRAVREPNSNNLDENCLCRENVETLTKAACTENTLSMFVSILVVNGSRRVANGSRVAYDSRVMAIRWYQ